MRFQRRHQLQEDGVVGERTRLALNMPVSARVNQLRINLERARWIRPSLERAPNVWVDIAGYRLHYTRPNGQYWDTRWWWARPAVKRRLLLLHQPFNG